MISVDIHNRVLRLSSLFCVLALTACMQSTPVKPQGQPDWVTGEAQLYPNSHYIVATGSASGAELAKDRALANLTRVFELHIRESSTTRQEVQSLKQRGNETVSSAQSLSQQVNIRTNKIIDGARVAEQWRQPDDLTYHALAVLDRHQAGNNIRGEIDRLDKETDFELQQADKKTSLLKVAAYQRALNLQDERDSLQKTLKVIDLSGRGSEARWNRAELRNKLEKSLNALGMQPAILQDSVGGLDKVLTGAMAHAGFVEAKMNTAYTLSAGLTSQSPVFSQGWHWLRGTLTLRLESADGKVQGNRTWPLKVSASDPAQLNQRLKAAAENTLNQELKATVLGFATRQ